VLAGDSAGGGLTVAALVQIRDSGLALPAGTVCLSPWVDLERDGDAASPLEDLAPEQLEEWSELYLAGADARDPRASPVHAALEGLPPTLIHVGSAETLRDDAVRLADALSSAGSAATLRIFDGLVHIFQVVPELPETEDSVGQIGAFILGLTS
jgi:acetyl esterase/lipase